MDDYRSLEIQCHVSGELRQQDNTDDLIFDIPFLIAYLSEIVTLKTGDIIFTGTPKGPKAVKSGDRLAGQIASIGTLNISIK